MKTILILDDNGERIAAFQKMVPALGDEFELKIWRDASSMASESESFFPTAAIISLSYGGDPKPFETGLDAAKFLAQARPVCPVIIHSTDTDHGCSMENELRFADWIVERIRLGGTGSIETIWLQKIREFLAAHPNTWPAKLPADHDERIQRALLSLDGLSVGDGFGECFFTRPEVIERRLESQDPPPPPWFVTDDTIMALSIVRCLKRYGHIEQDALAAEFAREYAREPQRGYGGTAHGILRAIGEGTPWETAAGRVFDGQGSCGNGGAMRAAPIGAYFAYDLNRVIAEAKASAEVTHGHPDGQTGAIAVALAAAWMVREREFSAKPSHALIEFVLEQIPHTDTYYRLKKALEVPLELSPRSAALFLGNGSQVISSDTVPFCLWCAARHTDTYTDALWTTVSGLGDRDTTCAIVGGIVALSAGRHSIPDEWLKAREPIKF
ncbi:MAG: N-formylglutamate deformylase [Pedosphaera sp.]|nr:N-formylglutamate deformylase [Pedosphaera sp.]